jgi:DNA-binding NtrC family response regulator
VSGDPTRKRGGERAPPGATLAVYGPTGKQVVELPEAGEVVVGRAEPATVVVDDPSLSRQHARFFREGGGVFVEDLGSTNGTFVRGARVTRAPLLDGYEARLGDVLVVVSDGRSAGDGGEGLVSYGELLEAATQELVRARTFGRPVALLAARFDRGAARGLEQLRATLRPVDALGLYTRDVALLLLPETDRARAASLAKNLGAFGFATGAAASPDDGATAELLLDAALARLAGRGATDAPALDDSALSSSKNARVRALADDLQRVARSQLTILVHGETGAGKDVLARLVHRASGRAGPMLATNCGAIPSGLIESTLFGHEKGAFTGADRAQRGLFEQAHEGTLFLDEVGELPPAAQVALLRVLETRTFRRVGGDRDVACDVRVVAATHRDLRAMAATGAFRGDLLYRLDGYSVVLPPLRERAEDVPELVRRFVDDANVRHGRAVRGLTPLALEVLQAYPFPGNVRELKNLVERAVVMARGELADAGDLPEHVRAPAATAAGPAPADGDLRERVKRYEAELIRAALGAAGGSRAKAAEALGLPLRTLAHKIKEHGIDG